MIRFENNHFDLDVLDVIAVEREARRLRAEATAQMFRDLAAWVSRKLPAHRAAGDQHAA